MLVWSVGSVDCPEVACPEVACPLLLMFFFVVVTSCRRLQPSYFSVASYPSLVFTICVLSVAIPDSRYLARPYQIHDIWFGILALIAACSHAARRRQSGPAESQTSEEGWRPAVTRHSISENQARASVGRETGSFTGSSSTGSSAAPHSSSTGSGGQLAQPAHLPQAWGGRRRLGGHTRRELIS